MQDSRVQFDAGLLSRYDRPGPRYTSYPTAVQFHERFGEAEYRAAAATSNDCSPPAPLSIYVHIPFCASPCFYCGCTKVITRNRTQAVTYLERLEREIEMQAALFDDARPIDQLHLGGGTPTFLDAEQISGLMATLGRHFAMRSDASREYSIEVDPRTVDPDMVDALAAAGFNRMSLGIQDFDPEVQKSVNRVQSSQATFALMARAAETGFKSVSVDLIYGLPLQTPQSFARTLDLVIGAKPDRLAVYSYAHMPHLFKPQKKILAEQLPSATEKLGLLELTIERLTGAGYVYIGMDHFAQPDDELAIALQDGSLQRNFQGYSTHAECDLVALGVSSIGAIANTYAQNYKALPDYYRAIDSGQLAIHRGIGLTADDRLRRAVIQSVMCRAGVDYAAFDREWDIRFEDYFSAELAALAPLANDGLLEFAERGFSLTPAGRLLMRNVAMCFDAYLKKPDSPAIPRYSRAI